MTASQGLTPPCLSCQLGTVLIEAMQRIGQHERLIGSARIVSSYRATIEMPDGRSWALTLTPVPEIKP